MRIAALEKNGNTAFYALEGDLARRIGPIGGSALSPFEGGKPEGEAVPWSPAELRAPVRPSKIVCIGRNYAAHAKELGNEVPKEPMLFFKPPSSIIGPGESIELPVESERVDHEAELGVVISKRVRRISREDAMSAVFGYTCVCDVSARDLQKKDGQWARAKGFDTFCPVGPWVETDIDPSDLAVECRVDGQVRQHGRTSQMIFDIPAIVAYVSNAFTLEPGDLIVTGTPEGVGPLAAGNELTIAIERIGELTVRVKNAPRV
ncbi:Fumarylacetoacetate hydrolase family protein [Labilithrix luteola]|uniref:Fumarylacetoacetate hydrolase family protein n=1 Tax=Labilithrix luteola TaxID=1391654 RepID=A0A0K1PUK0_9BACT|nr:fumarylacetoacetate hydrolase family protein [Labilithrix luteola]AKU96809.1 Fumarylacetoacetate hydrolase family protein [Labilithrix luteola]